LNAHFSAPHFLTDLIDIYGSPSQAGFGSAVFYEKIEKNADLESIALQYYQYFLGDLWTRLGETAWLSTWKQVYARQTGKTSQIVSELKAIATTEVASFVPLLLLTHTEQGEKAQKTLSAVYDDPGVAELRVYTIGDGGAMSGLLIIGHRTTGEAIILISLLD
jgi:hypothetical protein